MQLANSFPAMQHSPLSRKWMADSSLEDDLPLHSDCKLLIVLYWRLPAIGSVSTFSLQKTYTCELGGPSWRLDRLCRMSSLR